MTLFLNNTSSSFLKAPVVSIVLKAKMLLKETLQSMLDKFKPKPRPHEQGKGSQDMVSFESFKVIF